MKKLFLILVCIGCSIQYGMAQLDSLFVTEVREPGNNRFFVTLRPRFEQDPAKGQMTPYFGYDGFDGKYHSQFTIELFQGLFSNERKEELQKAIKNTGIRSFDMNVSLDNKGRVCYCSFFYSTRDRIVEPQELLSSEEWYKLYALSRTIIYDLTKHKVEYISDGYGGEPDYTTKEYEYVTMSFNLHHLTK